MSGDVSLDSAGDPWPPSLIAPRSQSISWIQVITAVAQFYCVMCHCVFLMLVALGMFVKELFRRITVHWKSWYNDMKERGPATLPLALRTIRVTVMSKIASAPEPQPSQQGDEVEEEAEEEGPESSQEQSEPPEVAEVNTSDGASVAPTVSASTSEGYSSSSHPESPGGVVTETESLASLPIRPQVQPATKRVPCSISAVVEDQYACRLNRSSSSSAVSLDELDDSSDDDDVNGFDESSKSSSGPSKSGTGSGSGSWNLKSAFHKATGKANDHQNRTSKPKVPSSQAPCPDKNKFSLGPVFSSLRRACSRTLSAINKEFTECMSAQNHKTRSKKSKTPATQSTSLAPQSRELHQPPQPDTNRDAIRDLTVPEQRTSVQSSWNDVCSSGGTEASSGSDSLGEMHRGLLDSFSEAESSDFPHRQTVDRAFGDTVISDEKPTPFSVKALGAKENLEKGDSDWTARKSQSNAFFASESAGANTFSEFF